MDRAYGGKMIITESCARCLYEKQKKHSGNEDYLREIWRIIEDRKPGDTPPALIYEFDKVHERYYGRPASYREEKKRYNDLMMQMEEAVRKRIEGSDDPLRMALSCSQAGNYIDFGALDEVDEKDFLRILDEAKTEKLSEKVLASFFDQLKKAKTFLLITDNCGEIVLDKLFLEQLKKSCPGLGIKVMVRGGEALNDATMEDVLYVGMDKTAEIISSGAATAGTIYGLLSEEAKRALDSADVILAKGQGNYESLSEQGRHIFYSFLCKCDKFVANFGVPQFSGMFIEER